MDLTSRLRAIVNSGPPKAVRELTYEPDDGYRNAAVLDSDYVASALGGRRVSNRFGECLVVDRRYESDRWHGGVQIGECSIDDLDSLRILDPALDAALQPSPKTIFIDLETTGLSGGAGTVAFLVGCGYFDLGAFQVRQFLLTSHAGERALLAAVAEFFDGADLIVTYNGKTFDVPVMETRWMFHRMEMPLEGVPHFDMLHPARRLWKHDENGCRLSTLERTLFDVVRVGDVPGMDIPARFFGFVRSGDPRPLEPVLEHNRIDLVSLAAVTARGMRMARDGHDGCRDCAEALALGKILERAGHVSRAEACYRLRRAIARFAHTRRRALSPGGEAAPGSPFRRCSEHLARADRIHRAQVDAPWCAEPAAADRGRGARDSSRASFERPGRCPRAGAHRPRRIRRPHRTRPSSSGPPRSEARQEERSSPVVFIALS